MSEVSEVQNEVALEDVFSKVYPTEIKYQSSDGVIESVYVKEGAVAFERDVDEHGNLSSNRLVIVIEVKDISKDIVAHRY